MGYIFESEIESIINAVRTKTIGEDDGVELKKILASDIHPAIKAYFKAEVERILVQERSMEYRSKKFPYSLPEVVSLQRQIDIVLVQRYHFDEQEFGALLDESVHFQFNYLCRPQWTLLNFIGGESRHIAASDIDKKLKYCVDYSYFPELIQRYLVDHGLADVTFEEFKALIEKIDAEVVAQHSSLELAKMTRALSAFVESGKMLQTDNIEQQALPINAAIVFFEDKQLIDIQTRLEFERDKREATQLTVEQLAAIIDAVRSGEQTVHQDQNPFVEPIHPPKAEEKQPVAVIPSTLPIVEPPAAVPQQSVEVKIDNVEQPEGMGKNPVLVFGEDDEQYLSPSPGLKQKEICELFNESEHELIVRKIFNKDEPAFLGAVMEICLQNSWEEVAHYLDALYLVNDVDPFGPEAILFTDRLFTHYHSAKSE